MTVSRADRRIPLVVGAIGHRDLVPQELPALTARVREFLAALQRRYPDLRVTLLTSLADGADRLAADIAKSLGMPIVYVLPMPSRLFEQDFDGASHAEYRELIRDGNVLTLPLVPGTTPEDVRYPGPARDLQYAQLGAFIAAHCHVLLALWDGNENGASGGTASIVRFHQDDYMPGLTDGTPLSRIVDVDDESDLVYHVVCSRAHTDGAPAEPLRAGDGWWLTRDADTPRTAEMPARYDVVFERMVGFSRDVLAHADAIDRAPVALLPASTSVALGAGDRAIAGLFGSADWLALYYGARTLAATRLLYALTALAGISFIAYGDLSGHETMIYPYLGFMAAAFAVSFVARRGEWQRRYRDYRVLAEALRVQFYWAIAGVERPEPSRFGHDAFMKRSEFQLGWIRNVLRVAGQIDDAEPSAPRDAGIDAAIAAWIGNASSGQLGYYRQKWPRLLRAHQITDRLGVIVLAAGLGVAAWLAFAQLWLDHAPTDYAVACMGVLGLLGVVRAAYTQRTAEHELISQYRFMERILTNAHRQLREASTPAERRRILRELGDAQLRENGQWFVSQRERPITTPS